jgi:hypothetical protein
MTDEQIGTIHLLANTRSLEDFVVELRALLAPLAQSAEQGVIYSEPGGPTDKLRPETGNRRWMPVVGSVLPVVGAGSTDMQGNLGVTIATPSDKQESVSVETLADELATAYGHHIEDDETEAGHWWTFDRDALAAFAERLATQSDKQEAVDHEALIAETLHYPDHWDTAAYSDVWAALQEVMHSFQCSECRTPDASAEQDRIDAERYRYLRNCGVIVDFNRSGPWKFTDDVDAAIDKYLARKAAIDGAAPATNKENE